MVKRIALIKVLQHNRSRFTVHRNARFSSKKFAMLFKEGMQKGKIEGRETMTQLYCVFPGNVEKGVARGIGAINNPSRRYSYHWQ